MGYECLIIIVHRNIQIDFSQNFVIVLCNPNPELKDQNLNGSIANQHYAELTHISGEVANYWSWQNKNTSNDTNRFEYIYIIKRPKFK